MVLSGYSSLGTPVRPPVQGTAMRQRLLAAGITPAAVKKKHGTGDFYAEWYEIDMEKPVNRASHYAQQLRDAFAGIEILRLAETIADWRPGKPVIAASVMFADVDMMERAVAPVVEALLRLPGDIMRQIIPLRLRVLLRRLVDLIKMHTPSPVIYSGQLFLLPAPPPLAGLLPAVAGVYL